MADQKTEKPTQQKVKKAREEGRFSVSREIVFAAQFFVFASLLSSLGGEWMASLMVAIREMLAKSMSPNLTDQIVILTTREAAWRILLPLVMAGMALYGAGAAVQLGSTGLGFSAHNLSPQFSRLMPGQRLKGLPKQNLTATLQAILLIPIFGAALAAVVSDNLPIFLQLPFMPLEASTNVAAAAITDLTWKACGVFVVWGAIDLFRQKRKYMNELKMTKQEIREEYKQADGNPEVKMRLRRMRKDLLRRRMMSEVPNATAVIVNPTHFAVAIRYNVQSMAAPRVVAKGKNYLALRIKAKALEHQVPVIENKPLAQALYKSVDVGQEIPAHLYRAVAEILAYIYRIMNGHLPG